MAKSFDWNRPHIALDSNTEELTCPLTPEDRVRLSVESGKAQSRIRQLDNREAKIKSRIKALRERVESHRDELLDAQAAGRERRPVDVVNVFCPMDGMVHRVRMDTGVVLKSWKASREESEQAEQGAPVNTRVRPVLGVVPAPEQPTEEVVLSSQEVAALAPVVGLSARVVDRVLAEEDTEEEDGPALEDAAVVPEVLPVPGWEDWRVELIHLTPGTGMDLRVVNPEGKAHGPLYAAFGRSEIQQGGIFCACGDVASPSDHIPGPLWNMLEHLHGEGELLAHAHPVNEDAAVERELADLASTADAERAAGQRDEDFQPVPPSRSPEQTAQPTAVRAAVMRCTRCDAVMGSCSCWEKCDCGWSRARGEPCGNPVHEKQAEKPAPVVTKRAAVTQGGQCSDCPHPAHPGEKCQHKRTRGVCKCDKSTQTAAPAAAGTAPERPAPQAPPVDEGRLTLGERNVLAAAHERKGITVAEAEPLLGMGGKLAQQAMRLLKMAGLLHNTGGRYTVTRKGREALEAPVAPDEPASEEVCGVENPNVEGERCTLAKGHKGGWHHGPKGRPGALGEAPRRWKNQAYRYTPEATGESTPCECDGCGGTFKHAELQPVGNGFYCGPCKAELEEQDAPGGSVPERRAPLVLDDPFTTLATDGQADSSFATLDLTALYGVLGQSRKGMHRTYTVEVEGSSPRACEACGTREKPRAWISLSYEDRKGSKRGAYDGGGSFGMALCFAHCTEAGVRLAWDHRRERVEEERREREQGARAIDEQPTGPGGRGLHWTGIPGHQEIARGGWTLRELGHWPKVGSLWAIYGPPTPGVFANPEGGPKAAAGPYALNDGKLYPHLMREPEEAREQMHARVTGELRDLPYLDVPREVLEAAGRKAAELLAQEENYQRVHRGEPWEGTASEQPPAEREPGVGQESRQRVALPGLPGWFLGYAPTGAGEWEAFLELRTAGEQAEWGPAWWSDAVDSLVPVDGEWHLSPPARKALEAAEQLIAAGQVPELHKPTPPGGGAAAAPAPRRRTIREALAVELRGEGPQAALWILDEDGEHGPIFFDGVAQQLAAVHVEDRATLDWLDDALPIVSEVEAWMVANPAPFASDEVPF